LFDDLEYHFNVAGIKSEYAAFQIQSKSRITTIADFSQTINPLVRIDAENHVACIRRPRTIADCRIPHIGYPQIGGHAQPGYVRSCLRDNILGAHVHQSRKRYSTQERFLQKAPAGGLRRWTPDLRLGRQDLCPFKFPIRLDNLFNGFFHGAGVIHFMKRQFNLPAFEFRKMTAVKTRRVTLFWFPPDQVSVTTSRVFRAATLAGVRHDHPATNLCRCGP
jgi:hypothetical protein